MDLETLRRRLEHEQGAEHDDQPVKILAPGGERYDILSLNWDPEGDEWVIIGE